VQLVLDVPDDPNLPCRLFCGTEEGEVITVQLSNPGEGTRGVTSLVAGHYSSCVELQRSPTVGSIYLSVGDWTFNLWREGVPSPLFTSPFAPCLLTCGVCAPTRPAVVVIGKADGSLDIWDLLDRSHEPSMTVNITSAAISSLCFHTTASKQLLAVGDDLGTVHVMEVPRNLRRAVNNEKGFTLNFFEREQKRVAYVEQRAVERKEAAEAAKQAAEKASSGEAPQETGATEAADSDEKYEKAFRDMEEKFKQQMAISTEEEPAPAADSADADQY